MSNEVMAMDNLELNITPASVELNGLEPLKALARQRMAELREFPVQEETYKGAKDFRAEANKLAKIVHDYRMRIKKGAMGDLDALDADMFEFEKELKDGANEIGGRLAEYEEGQKQKKLKLVSSEVEKIAENHNIVAEKIVIDDRWLNKSYSWPKMQEEIEAQAKTLAAEQKAMLANIENVEMYAKVLGIEAGGYVAMLQSGNDVSHVRGAMEAAVEAEKLRLEARKKKLEEARIAQEKALERAESVGDKKVDTETGEVIAEWQEPTSTYQYTFSNMTLPQKEWLDNKLKSIFDQHDITFTTREV